MSAGNVTIMGKSYLSGGTYNAVKIFGSARTKEDLEVERISIFGSAELCGIKAGRIRVAGSARFEGQVNVGTFSVAGEVNCYAAVKAQELKIFGSLAAREEVSAERFSAKRRFELTSLNANDVEIALAATCRVKEIGAENIKVKNGTFLGFPGFAHYKKLQVEAIEADRIELVNTVANVVKGNQVIIGPGCEIGSVEYRDSLEIDRNSTVKEQIKTR